MTQRRITDDLQALMDVLPSHITRAVAAANHSDDLLEIILDLGRLPMARFVDKEIPLSENEVTHLEIDHVVSRIGDFDADNRAGLERTLHRISAIRNRRGHIVGLTCRVGRAVYGTIDILLDVIESGKSVLILGRPGVGKTTMLREAARILAEKKRVIVVDTSNEIGGDGDVPHPAVGKARRMQVATPSLQHEVMIEAVENHNPEVIVIDEIGRELEAAAARTIAERGVQLIGTAHGRTLENLLLNPTLSDLVGGIESVTLSDEEARRRGTQKTVLERRSPPTFDILIEIQERNYLLVHPDIATAVDALVRGAPPAPEARIRGEDGEIRIEKAASVPAATQPVFQQRTIHRTSPSGIEQPANGKNGNGEKRSRFIQAVLNENATASAERGGNGPLTSVHIYPYGVARNRLLVAAKRLGVPLVVAREVEQADVLITLKTYYHNRQQPIMDAEQRGMPIYVLRSNTINQIEQAMAELFNLSVDASHANWDEVTAQAETAIQGVLNGEAWVDLPPASSTIRRMQHELARQAQLVSHSYGREPNRRVRIYRE